MYFDYDTCPGCGEDCMSIHAHSCPPLPETTVIAPEGGES